MHARSRVCVCVFGTPKCVSESTARTTKQPPVPPECSEKLRTQSSRVVCACHCVIRSITAVPPPSLCQDLRAVADILAPLFRQVSHTHKQRGARSNPGRMHRRQQLLAAISSAAAQQPLNSGLRDDPMPLGGRSRTTRQQPTAAAARPAPAAVPSSGPRNPALSSRGGGSAIIGSKRSRDAPQLLAAPTQQQPPAARHKSAVSAKVPIETSPLGAAADEQTSPPAAAGSPRDAAVAVSGRSRKGELDAGAIRPQPAAGAAALPNSRGAGGDTPALFAGMRDTARRTAALLLLDDDGTA